VSSTSEDLKEYREAARDVIMDVGWYPVMMGHFGATPGSTVEVCRNNVSGCDVFLLIVAFRRGWVPNVELGSDGQRSITAWELEAAERRNVDVLAFLAESTWPGNLWEQDDAAAHAWMKDFRANLNLIATLFAYEPVELGSREILPQFRAKLRERLVIFKEKRLLGPRSESELTAQLKADLRLSALTH
jgi:hypothetical protein